MTRAFEDYDPEEPEDFDRDDDPDGTDTEPCPFCKRDVHDRTDICPHCGNFISWETPKPSRTSWIVVTVIVLLLLGLLALVLGGRPY